MKRSPYRKVLTRRSKVQCLVRGQAAAACGSCATRLSQEIAKALADPVLRKKYEDLGLTPVGSTPREFAADLPEQAHKWREVLQAMGLRTP